MLQKALIEDLQKLGLNIYEAKVYLALIERESLDTAEVAQISGVPRARTYDVLDNLVRRGLATLKPGKQKIYGALDLDSFRQRLIDDNREESAEREKRIEQAAKSLKAKLAKIYNPDNQFTDPLQYIEIIRNPLRIHQKFLHLIESSKTEILIFSRPPYAANQEQIAEQFRQQAKLLKRGVKVKCIYEIPKNPKERSWWLEIIRGAAQHGEESKSTNELPIKMAIFDEQIVIYTLEDPILHKTSVTTLVTEHRSLARSLKMLFESIWETSMDYRSLKLEGGD